MNPYIKTLEQEAQMEREIPEFRIGDTLLIHRRVREVKGEGAKEVIRERLQPFEGVAIARKNKGSNSSVTLRKITGGEGIELVQPLYSPLLASIEVKRPGVIRQAKPYYLRALRGKAARIKERYAKKPSLLQSRNT